MSQTHTVIAGDSLWKISRKYQIDIKELASANQIKDSNSYILPIGKVLIIPSKHVAQSDSILKTIFRGIDSKPFTPSKVKVEKDGKIHDFTGAALKHLDHLEIWDFSKGLKIWIEDLNKKMIQVLHINEVPLGKKVLTIDSRQVLIKGQTLPKKTTVAADALNEEGMKRILQREAQKSGATADGVALVSGEPIHMAVTVNASENLRLHPANEIYRKDIINAAKAHGFTPQTLAAIIGAEAVNLKGGKWKESSQAEKSSAGGLTQFIEGTWLSCIAADSRSLLAKENNIKAMKEKNILDQRYIAKYSIDAAALYAVQNLAILKANGLDADGLAPEDKAKLAYLCHHGGAAGAIAIITNTLDIKIAKSKLPGQIGEEKAKELEKRYGNFKAAYIGWMCGYIDSKINVNHFTINPGKDPRSMAEIISILNAHAPTTANQAKPSTTIASNTDKYIKAPSNPPKPEVKPAAPVAQTPVKPAAPIAQTTAAPPTQTESGGWCDPLDVCTLRTATLLSIKGASFGMTRNKGTKGHQGIDLVAIPGTPIKAVCDSVVFAIKNGGDYGQQIILEVNINDLPEKQKKIAIDQAKDANIKTIYIFYAHLSKIEVKNKDHIKTGDILGKTGSTGNANNMTTVAKGSHLHFEVRKNQIWPASLLNRLDPLPFINNCTNSDQLKK
jgi:murein DD-endopeptidase MepM/ murein hydrolase activator NlpD